MAWLLESRLLRSARPFVPSSQSFDNATMGIGSGGRQPGGQDDNAMRQTMCDLLLGEIQAEIDRVQKEAERRRQEELKLTNQPDYSWLMDWRLRSRQPLGFRESSEVEMLCTKLRPGEWRRLLEEWRRKVRFAFERDEVLDLFRESVDQLVAERMERECRMESVDERHEEKSGHPKHLPHQAQSATNAMPTRRHHHQPQQKRPNTAHPRIPYPAQLSVFTLMGGSTDPQMAMPEADMDEPV